MANLERWKLLEVAPKEGALVDEGVLFEARLRTAGTMLKQPPQRSERCHSVCGKKLMEIKLSEGLRLLL